LIQPLEELSYLGIAEQNWMEAWKERFKPLNVGLNFLVQPAWLENPDTRRHIIRIDPGMAFGTGVHPTTQLALELMEKNIRPGWKILDLGAGSGILSFAAEKLSADAVFGIEIDADAIDNALHNAEINNSSVDLMHGSIDDAKGKRPANGFDMVIANIIATKLLVLIADGLCELVSDEGQLLLSGILVDQMHEIESALGKKGYEVKESLQKEDWLALIAQNRT
jgi:ribosomal protein L11 methyltransferase